jgi:hypothetical protein
MNTRLPRLALTFAAMAALMLLAAAPATAASQSIRYQDNFSVFVPCANGGLGEDIDGTVRVHELIGVTEDGAGGFHSHIEVNYHGVAVGAVTGDIYRIVFDGSTFDNDVAGGGEAFDLILRGDAIGQGTASDFGTTIRSRVTVNAHGDVTVDRFVVTETCN